MSQTKNLREIQKVIDELGLTAAAVIGRGSKSITVSLKGTRDTRKVFAPCTPSDHRNFLNLRRDMKRVAMELGLA